MGCYFTESCGHLRYTDWYARLLRDSHSAGHRTRRAYSEEAVPRQWLEQFPLFVGQVGYQRVGEQVDGRLQGGDAVRLADVAHQCLVDLVEYLVDRPVLGLQPVKHRTEPAVVRA